MYVLRESAAPPLPRAISYATKAGSPEPRFPRTPRCHLHSLGSMQLGLWACSKHPSEAKRERNQHARHPTADTRLRANDLDTVGSRLVFSGFQCTTRDKVRGVTLHENNKTCSKQLRVACLQYYYCRRASRQAPWRCFAVPVVRLRF